MATYHTLPPYRSLGSTQISAQEAQGFLSSYLTLSETTEHLHPDALLNTAGVQFSAQGGSMGGIIIHNLRRIEAGLRGERLEPEPDKAEPEQEQEQDGELSLEKNAEELNDVLAVPEADVEDEVSKATEVENVQEDDEIVDATMEDVSVAETPKKHKKSKKDKKKRNHEMEDDAQDAGWQFDPEPNTSEKGKRKLDALKEQQAASEAPLVKDDEGVDEETLSKEERRALKKARKEAKKAAKGDDGEKKRKKDKKAKSEE